MIYTDMQPTVGLTSTWRCNFYVANGRLEWYIVDTPTSDSRTVTFSVDIPAGAVVRRAWLSMGINTPISGSAYQRVNGLSIPSDGVVELDGITADTTSYEAVFDFRANGVVYQDTQQHSGQLSLIEPTLHIEYDEDGGDEEPDQDGTIVGTPIGTGLQLPRLLGDDYREVARLEPSNLRLALKLHPLSTAEMRLPVNGPEVKPRAFVELFSPNGSAGIFRASEIRTDYGYRDGRMVYLEHAICTLADSLAIGTQAMSGPVRTVISTLLQGQNIPLWVLGDCDVPDEYELVYEHSFQNLLQAIIQISELLPREYAFDFDTTRLPFVMHLRLMPEDDECECRMNRNLTSAHLTVDASGICTRVYPFGAGEGTDRVSLTSLTGSDYLDSQNAELWGTVSKTFTSGDIFDALTLRDVAQRYLDRHDHPLVSVTMDAMDLSEATGEDFDRFRLGRRCRLALPEWGVAMHERVVGLEWSDVYGNPKGVEVTLANRIRNASDEIAQLMREATNSKLLGGSVGSLDTFSRSGGISPTSPFQMDFDIAGYGNILNVKAAYSCTTSSGEKRTCTILVDGTEVPRSDAYTVDITRYLRTDDSGVPVVGDHVVILQPNTINTVTSEVECTVTVKQIDKR